jgi:protein gp37
MSKIEWTDKTWNPVTGCKEVSAGCAHCYAKTFAERWRGVVDKKTGKQHPHFHGFDLRLRPERLMEVVRRKKPTVYFVCSMSDLFHEDIPDEYLRCVFDVMACASWHCFQVLTKRSERMRKWSHDNPMPRNVMAGVSVENKQQGLPRIADLSATLVRTRFLSVEPLLEDLGELAIPQNVLEEAKIGTVIVGGESGPGARPMRPEWVRSIRDQCAAQNVGFFFKQWGGTRKAKAGRLLDGRTHDEMRLPSFFWPGMKVSAYEHRAAKRQAESITERAASIAEAFHA